MLGAAKGLAAINDNCSRPLDELAAQQGRIDWQTSKGRGNLGRPGLGRPGLAWAGLG